MRSRTVRHPIVLVPLLAAAALAGSVSPAFADQTVRIASWNIEHLGERDWGQHPEARAQEAQALVEKLPLLREHFGGEQDVILIGDTNCLEGAEPAIGLYEDAGFRDLNESDAVTYRKGSYASPFDRILIPLGESEFRYSRQYVLSPADPSSHLARLSDHFVVMMSMRVLEDDDP